MRRLGRTLAALALALALPLAAGCDGGEATPVDQIEDMSPTGPDPAQDPGVRDPGGDLDEPDPGDPGPTDQPGIVTPEPTPGG